MKLTRVLKPLTALLATAVIGVSALGTLPASATASFLGDVNCDGKLDMSDTVALGKYLLGNYALADYENADTNANGIIDTIDNQILLSFLIGNIPSLPYTE